MWPSLIWKATATATNHIVGAYCLLLEDAQSLFSKCHDIENKLSSASEDENNLVLRYSEPGIDLHSLHYPAKSWKHYSSIWHSFCQSSQFWSNSVFPAYTSFLHIGKCEVDILIHLLLENVLGHMLNSC